jgi:hypothetical protein
LFEPAHAVSEASSAGLPERARSHAVGYDALYEYAGVRYQSRPAQDPGAHIALNLSVVPVGAAAPTVVTPHAVMVMLPPMVEVGSPR